MKNKIRFSKFKFKNEKWNLKMEFDFQKWVSIIFEIDKYIYIYIHKYIYIYTNIYTYKHTYIYKFSSFFKTILYKFSSFFKMLKFYIFGCFSLFFLFLSFFFFGVSSSFFGSCGRCSLWWLALSVVLLWCCALWCCGDICGETLFYR